MPRTIAEGFRDFLTKLTPSGTESDSAKSHRASVEARLKRDFGLLRLFRIGSFGNGTSISGYSDVDYLASLGRTTLTSDSTYSLGKIRDALTDRFPNTGVRVSCPAIVIPFGTRKSETTEIVPGDYIEKKNEFAIYDIPDCARGWMRASPEAHLAYVAAVNDKLNGKVKPLVRFIKAWKCFQSVPISSFYLELRVAKYSAGESSIIYDIDILQILKLLWDGQLASMQDPMGVSGYIDACKTESFRKDALSKLSTAYTRAIKAREAAANDNISVAFDWWRLIYGEQFSSYYY